MHYENKETTLLRSNCIWTCTSGKTKAKPLSRLLVTESTHAGCFYSAFPSFYCKSHKFSSSPHVSSPPLLVPLRCIFVTSCIYFPCWNYSFHFQFPLFKLFILDFCFPIKISNTWWWSTFLPCLKHNSSLRESRDKQRDLTVFLLTTSRNQTYFICLKTSP